MSIGPISPSTRSTRAAIAASSVTSSSTPRHADLLADGAAASPLRSATTTARAPFAIQCRATAEPIPPPPPVTIATRSVISMP